jgi:type II secretory pathway component PulK
MLFKVTTVMIQQNNSASDGRKRTASHTDSNTFLNASLAEVASWNNLPKSSPSGFERINPYVTLGEDSTIERNERFKDLIDKTQTLIQR